MKIASDQIDIACHEPDIYNRLLSLDNKHILELGCGADFAEFENHIINATHANHRLDQKLYDKVKQTFENHMGEHGARFLNPTRVDLLQRPL